MYDLVSSSELLTVKIKPFTLLTEKFEAYTKAGEVGRGLQNAKNSDQGKVKVSYTDNQKD